jgi:hypothetical protein
MPYIQPILGERIGINVNYSDETDSWLAEDDRLGEWAVAFYSLSYPQTKGKPIETLLQDIILRRNKNSAPTMRKAQTYRDRVAINRES